MKTATILFYVSPSIETHIKNAKTIDLMEGGNEQAQNVPNSEINPCHGDGKEGHADGSSRDVPIQTDSEGAKKPVDICVDGEEGKADGSSDKNDKIQQIPRAPHHIPRSPLPQAPHQIPRTSKSPHLWPSSVLVLVVFFVIRTY